MRDLRVQALRSRRETRVTRARRALVAARETERLKVVRGARTVLAVPLPARRAYRRGLRHVAAAAGRAGCCSAVCVTCESDCWLERRVSARPALRSVTAPR